jgi:hypothetical protein
VLIDGAGAEESIGVSGGIWRDSSSGVGRDVGNVESGVSGGRDGAGVSGDRRK